MSCRRPRSVLAAMTAMMLALAACDADRRAISRDDLPAVPDEPTATVRLGDDGFDPDVLEVSTDDLIAFEISGDRHGVRTEDHAIDTGPLFDGETTLVMLPEVGEYVLVDTEDDGVSMVVTVTDR